MHHKRKGPKSTRAGCLMCKPHKRQGAPLKDRQRHSAVKGLATMPMMCHGDTPAPFIRGLRLTADHVANAAPMPGRDVFRVKCPEPAPQKTADFRAIACRP